MWKITLTASGEMRESNFLKVVCQLDIQTNLGLMYIGNSYLSLANVIANMRYLSLFLKPCCISARPFLL